MERCANCAALAARANEQIAKRRKATDSVSDSFTAAAFDEELAMTSLRQENSPSRTSKLSWIAWLAVGLLNSGCEKYALDRQMEDLCEKDGGVKIYETVTLPAELFDQWGDPFPGWRGRPSEERLGPQFRYEWKIIEIKKGNALKGEGELKRFEVRIFRRSDGKLLGEGVSFGRSGGDFIAFAHPTSRSCPEGQSESDVIRRVFVR